MARVVLPLAMRVPNPPAVFVGRDDASERLAERLRRGPLAIAHGPDGAGKLAVVLHVLHKRFKSRVPHTLMVRGRPDEAIEQSVVCVLASVAGLPRVPAGDVAEVALDLAEAAGAWVVVDGRASRSCGAACAVVVPRGWAEPGSASGRAAIVPRDEGKAGAASAAAAVVPRDWTESSSASAAAAVVSRDWTESSSAATGAAVVPRDWSSRDGRAHHTRAPRAESAVSTASRRVRAAPSTQSGIRWSISTRYCPSSGQPHGSRPSARGGLRPSPPGSSARARSTSGGPTRAPMHRVWIRSPPTRDDHLHAPGTDAVRERARVLPGCRLPRARPPGLRLDLAQRVRRGGRPAPVRSPSPQRRSGWRQTSERDDDRHSHPRT